MWSDEKKATERNRQPPSHDSIYASTTFGRW